MSAAAYSCRTSVAGASDPSTLKLDVGRRRRVAGRQVEKAHGIAIAATLMLPDEFLHPKSSNSPSDSLRPFNPSQRATALQRGAVVRLRTPDFHRPSTVCTSLS